ncbi:MAG: gluconate 2-dehydrogenase subunit 3 family protein [Chitinophagaceae bacterium]
MNRREAISAVSLLLGGSIVGSNLLLSGCKNPETKVAENLEFDQDKVAFLDEIGETIIPATSTPGAKAAKVGEYMKVIVDDCYDEKNRKIFIEGLAKINEASKKKFDKSFLEADANQRHALLVDLDNEQKEYMKKKKKDESSHYFRMMKELTLLGYFTSEIGCTQALRYVDVPGKYEGCVPYKKGDKAWA